jgi:hypothetical protein
MIPSNRKNAKTAQQIEIFGAVPIEQVLALALLKADVIADCLENANQLFVQMAHMHGTALRLPVHKHLGNV